MKRLRKTIVALAATGGAGVILLLAVLWSEHSSELTLPTPTGPFAVGRVTDAWVDDKHVDPFAEAPGSKRELLVWTWYPATRPPTAKAADYLPADWRGALTRHRGVLLSTFLMRDLALVHSHSAVDATLSPEQPAYPIVILRAGLGALTTDYTTLAEDLASHGYVVVGFDAPYRTALVVLPDGRVVTRRPSENPETLLADARDRLVARRLTAWTADIEFVVDRLERLNASATGRFHGKLDLQALGIVGHSLGGAVAAQFCHDDPRCRAAIDLDGAPHGSVVLEGLRQPLMFLLSDHGDTSDPVSHQIMTNIQSIYDRLPHNGRLRIVIRGANHFSFSDQMLLRSQGVIWLLQMVGVLKLEPRRGLAVTAEYVHRFFDVHLKGAPAALLQGPSPEYPELQFDTSGPSQQF
jgi:predicted dienelactone hydrolase